MTALGLLRLQSVTKRYLSARREHVALRDVSLEVDAGELIGVWGMRRSGRTTLLRLAGGVEAPDEGRVLFEDSDLRAVRNSELGRRIGYASPSFMSGQGGTVVDHVAVGLLAQGMTRPEARSRADATLARTGLSACADIDPRLLDPGEAIRVGIARALAPEPRLLLLDEPTSGVDLLQRDSILGLIRTIADQGVAVLMTLGEAVTVADRMLSIDRGRLRGDIAPENARVVPIRRARGEHLA